MKEGSSNGWGATRLFFERAAALVLAVCAFSAIAAGQSAPAPHRGPQGWAAQQKDQAWAAEKLAKSPRRREWVTAHNGSRALKAWVDHPSVKGKVPVVLVLHEVFGLTDSTRNTADEIAAMGYIAITPDLLSGYGPNGGNSESFEPPYDPSKTLTSLPDLAVDGDISAWADYAAKLPGSDGTFAIVGLSWGGGAAFRYVAMVQRKDLKAVCVFYDVGPPQETQRYAGASTSISVGGIEVPVHGFYPGEDTRVMKTIQATTEAMSTAAKTYDPVVYSGAEHAYMRLAEDPADKNPANVAALKQSEDRLREILKSM